MCGNRGMQRDSVAAKKVKCIARIKSARMLLCNTPPRLVYFEGCGLRDCHRLNWEWPSLVIPLADYV